MEMTLTWKRFLNVRLMDAKIRLFFISSKCLIKIFWKTHHKDKTQLFISILTPQKQKT